MSTEAEVVITGLGIGVSGVKDIEYLLTAQPAFEAEGFDPAETLRGRGWRYKDRATKLALYAARDALARAGLPVEKFEQPKSVGIVVSSNLGNADTVCKMVQTLRRGSVEDLSAMDLPNASSNVISSTLAIHLDCRAVNIMLCNGATSGLDALYTAMNVIKAGRARRMLVVGVEPYNPVVSKLMAESRDDAVKSSPDLPLAEGAACVILEATSTAVERDAYIYGTLSDYRYVPPSSVPEPSVLWALENASVRPQLWLTPSLESPETRAVVDDVLGRWGAHTPKTVDLTFKWGELYGALGIFQCIFACLWLRQGTTGDGRFTVLATAGGNWGDGLSSLIISNSGSWRR